MAPIEASYSPVAYDDEENPSATIQEVADEDPATSHELSLKEESINYSPDNLEGTAGISLHQQLDKDSEKGCGILFVANVVAPATLPEGYVFDASIGGGRTIKVTVPPGGIEEGQTFQVALPREVESIVTGKIYIPVGHWRDGLMNIFGFGICHPHFWTACFCHLLAAAQVHRRLNLTWYGRPGKASDAAVAFQILITAITGYFSLYIGLFLLLVYLDPNTYTPESAPALPVGSDYMFVLWFRDIMHYVYWVMTTIVLTSLRHSAREKYAIPGSEHEDCCWSCFCPCLVSAQLLRHTTDYNHYPSTCCTETGIPPNAPTIV